MNKNILRATILLSLGVVTFVGAVIVGLTWFTTKNISPEMARLFLGQFILLLFVSSLQFNNLIFFVFSRYKGEDKLKEASTANLISGIMTLLVSFIYGAFMLSSNYPPLLSDDFVLMVLSIVILALGALYFFDKENKIYE